MLQRKLGCACGGGCPRCKNKLAIQAKLTVNQPGDRFEQEADRMADAVMRMPGPSSSLAVPASGHGQQRQVQRRCSECEEEIQRTPESIQRMCPECEEELNREPEEKLDLQAKEVPGRTSEVTKTVQAPAKSLLSGGSPMTESARAFFEPRFGCDFSSVRVHADERAAQSAEHMHALAYTVGRDIVFGTGSYSPDTYRGRHLLAHELTHVVQQSDARSSESVQRVAEDDSSPLASCATSTPLPSLEQWSANSTLNGIRSEALGDNRVLVRRGQKGETVQLIQQALLAWGCEHQNRNLLPNFGADADFGGETESAVRSFQNAMGISQDGLIGPITLSRLDAFVAFGTIPEFPSVNCKVVPPDIPVGVIQALASLGFAASSEFASTAEPTAELAVSAGIAGVPIFCQVKGAGGARKAPPGICAGKPQHVVSIGNATFALCDFINGSRMTAGVVPLPSPGNEAGFTEIRALGIALFGSVGQSLPTTGPGSKETDWQHGFIQTVQSLKYTATYQRGWSSVREVSAPRRDATGSGVSEPWYSNMSIPAFSFQVGKQTITVSGPIALGPEFIGTDPVGILDDPRAIFVDTVPINTHNPAVNNAEVCPCSFLQSIEAKGELDTWLVVTPTGKGKTEAELAFLQHAAIEFDLKADKASGFAVTGTPTMTLENGRGSKAPVLTGSLANDDLKSDKTTKGADCPVTIPPVKCPVESPKGPPRR
jgi:peptidoglycan hydrolase-like protein with peptidoglycan-binding domain